VVFPERLGRELIGRIAENAAHRFVDPEPPAIRRDMSNSDWCALERDPEPRLAVGESAPGLDLLGNRLGEWHGAANPGVDGAPWLHRPPFHRVRLPWRGNKSFSLASSSTRQHWTMDLPRRDVYLVERTADDLGGLPLSDRNRRETAKKRILLSKMATAAGGLIRDVTKCIDTGNVSTFPPTPTER
jgi:hypothetical protein